MLISLPIFYALISRWYGGGFFSAPKLIKTITWSIPIGVIVCYLLLPHLSFGLSLMSGVTAALLCGLGKSTGHGGGIDIGHSPKEPGFGRDLELLEPLIYWAYTYLPRGVYDAVLLSITGLASVLGACLILATFYPIPALILAVSGLLKGPAYIIGWYIIPSGRTKSLPDVLNEPNEIGELLSGAFIGAGLAVAIIGSGVLL